MFVLFKIKFKVKGQLLTKFPFLSFKEVLICGFLVKLIPIETTIQTKFTSTHLNNF